MFKINNISYIHQNRELLFDNINLTVNAKDKIAIIGNNGVGKSTLLKIIAGQLFCSEGSVSVSSEPYYVPQIVGQFDNFSVAQVLKIDKKLNALSEILSGNATTENLSDLNEDWLIEERCHEAFLNWGLCDRHIHNAPFHTLSGGEKTKVFLAGITLHNPEIVLLDEPTNHLDLNARKLLYKFISETSCTVAVVSHDRVLLNQLAPMCELNKHGIKIYGGNYDFYKEQKTFEQESSNNNLEEKQKSLKKAKQIERESIERQQKMSERGKKQQKKEGTPKVMIDKMKNDSENSTARLKGVLSDKINAISHELSDLRKEILNNDKMKLGLTNSVLHKGKILIKAKEINYNYADIVGQICNDIFKNHLNFQIISGERIAIKGNNGSGKTTLLKLILGNLHPTYGEIFRDENKKLYIDQDYSLINNNLSVERQAQIFNDSSLQEHEIKICLNRFLFTKECWDKPCSALSGGERMRLLLCCITIAQQSPDIIILDEPTNNIDIQNVEILTAAINEYKGTIIVVSHDLQFLRGIGIEKEILL